MVDQNIAIREARPEDMPRLLEMSCKFHAAAGLAAIAEWERESARATINAVMSDGIAIVLESNGKVVGMAGALIYPFYFNHGHVTGQELVWWTDPEHRGKGMLLRKDMERRARDRGVVSFQMSAIEGLKNQALERLYLAWGYRPLDHTFIKRLV